MSRREWWIAILLFFIGGGCLTTAVQATPFGPVSEFLIPFLKGLRILFLFLLALLLFRVMQRWVEKRTQKTCSCGTPIKASWHYCPHCGQPSIRPVRKLKEDNP
ncbi:hypothetical protein [Paludifilum halophilum]|uniref:Zinc-ribbon domain-containing protein n=1 Tax=Paludifilum halophilum TaxID=1642702 RepID=A0A235B720_9BACL|nr:hypothetical protein [Paludifilum halophilum]OYD08100.1 hypothetical protein CHM34_08290 [Paludifilum halophilum]